MNKNILMSAAALVALPALAFLQNVTPKPQEARWIWYPGDYGIWWGNELQSERLQWGSRLTPFWPLYEPHSRVLFRKDVKLDADEPLEVRCDGNATICWWDGTGGYNEGAVLLGKFTLPKDAKAIEIKIQNNARPCG